MRRPFFRVPKIIACTMPQLRVPWCKTACSAPKVPEICWKRVDLRVVRQRNCVQRGQLREPCAGGLRQTPKTATSPSLPPPPAAHMAALRQPNLSPVTHAPGGQRQAQRPHRRFLCLFRQQATQQPCVSRTAALVAALRQPKRSPRCRPTRAETPVYANTPQEPTRAKRRPGS